MPTFYPLASRGALNYSTINLYSAVGADISGSSIERQTESHVSVRARTAATYRKLWMFVQVGNGRVAEIKFRKNSADGNQALSVAVSTTGVFIDASGTDDVAVGDLVALRFPGVAAGAPCFVDSYGIETTVPAWRMVGSTNVLEPVTNARACPPYGPFTWQTIYTESAHKLTTQVTVKNLYYYVSSSSSPSPTSTATIALRRYGDVGNPILGVSVDPGESGEFEDLSSAVVTAGTVLQFSADNPTYSTGGKGSGSCLSVEYAPSSGLTTLSSAGTFLYTPI